MNSSNRLDSVQRNSATQLNLTAFEMPFFLHNTDGTLADSQFILPPLRKNREKDDQISKDTKIYYGSLRFEAPQGPRN
jgi:hypothetical protein